MVNSHNTKIVVAGNVAMDAIIDGKAEISADRSSVKIISPAKEVKVDPFDRVTIEFQVEDPPITEGHKHRVGQALEERVEVLWHKRTPGGGGYHSVTGMRTFYEPEKLGLVYIDVSSSNRIINQGLAAKRVRSHFFGERDVPLNAIIGGRGDKIILKGPHLGRFSPSPSEIEEAELHIEGSNAVLINSVKDKGYVEGYIGIANERNIPLYFVVTPSIEDIDFVNEKVLPAGVNILNYDDLVDLYSVKGVIDEQGKMEYALDTIQRLRTDKVTDKNIYVTLGENGAYCSDRNSIFHVKLNDKYAEKVQKAILTRTRNINGAGDNFAASVVLSEVLEKEHDPVKVTLKASMAAIKYIGYRNLLPKDAFLVNKM